MPGNATFTDYVFRSYKRDLERFAAAYRGESSAARGERLGYRDKFLCICDAAPRFIEEAIASGRLDDPRRFAIVLALEATLFAGVHSYDPSNFDRYVETLPWTIYVEAHGWSGVHRPHVILVGMKDWGPDGEKALEKGWAELLPAWANQYDQTFGRKSGAAIVRKLAIDPELALNPYNQLPEGLMQAIKSGFSSAVEQLGT